MALRNHAIDQSHKSHNAPVPYPMMLHSEQKCAHFCSEWYIMGYGTGALWDARIRSMVKCHRSDHEGLHDMVPGQ